MDGVIIGINEIIKSGAYKDLLSILKGFRNGAVYGAKIRFPHALVIIKLIKGHDFAL